MQYKPVSTDDKKSFQTNVNGTLKTEQNNNKNYCTLCDLKNGRVQVLRLIKVVQFIKLKKDPCLYIDRGNERVSLCEYEDCHPEQTICPHRKEAEAASFLPTQVGENAYAIRISCIKSPFSDSLQLVVLFTEKDGRPELLVQSVIQA